jgi:type I restriction enzyme M protein
MNNFKEKANFLWSIADLLRGHYKQADYGKVILPLTVNVINFSFNYSLS